MALYFVQFVSFLHEWFFELFGFLVQEVGLVVGLAAKPGKCSIGVQCTGFGCPCLETPDNLRKTNAS